MPAFPSTESILLKVRQAIGVFPGASTLSTSDKAAFADIGLSAARQHDIAERLIGEILSLLDLDDDSREYFLRHLLQWGNHHKNLELDTWTSGASDRQVAWVVLSRSIVPTLARLLAWWDVDGALAPGMPTGAFWFLPTIATNPDRLELPPRKVLAWLADLYGTSAAEYQHYLGDSFVADGSQDARLRNVYNWKKGRLPQASSIRDTFPDTAAAPDPQKFKGAFFLDPAASPAQAFKEALAFVQRKKLEASVLARQIAFPDEQRLAQVLAGQGSEAERDRFVDALRARYVAPSPRTIRQRLLVARAMQAGYASLVKFLCPGVDPDCTDPARNKLLQLAGLFTRVFNLTVVAHNQAGGAGEAEEDRCFEAAMTPYERDDLLLAIVPGRKPVAHRLVPLRWSTRFERISADDGLEDLAPTDPGHVENFVQRVVVRALREADDDRRVAAVLKRVKTSSPWRAMQDQSFEVLRQIVQTLDAPAQARRLACERLVQVAATPDEKAEATLQLALDLLARDRKQRPADAEQQIDALLAQARATFEGGHREPVLRNAEAKQLLFKGQLKEAQARYRSALEACSSWGCGRLRGEIARDLLALEVADTSLPPGEHRPVDKYYRNMVAFGMFEHQLHDLEDTATWAHDFFWNDLYQPYPGAPSIRRPQTVAARKTLAELGARISTDEPVDFVAWLASHRMSFERLRLNDVRGDSVLTFFLKVLPKFCAAGDDRTAYRLRDFLRALIAAWPAQADLADFKGQTPLMLAADDGESELVRQLLAAGASVDAQDYRGRTALHAAVTGRSSTCVNHLLASGPDAGKVTTDEAQTVLHTAVRVGDAAISRQIVQALPGLRNVRNAYGRTPAQELENLVDHHAEFAQVMLENHRIAPSIPALQEVAELLRI